jgi:hypothetical protein
MLNRFFLLFIIYICIIMHASCRDASFEKIQETDTAAETQLETENSAETEVPGISDVPSETAVPEPAAEPAPVYETAVPEPTEPAAEYEPAVKPAPVGINHWLESKKYNPMFKTVIADGGICYYDEDMRIDENRALLIKDEGSAARFPEPESITLANPGIENGVLTVTEGTINLLIPVLTPENAKSSITFTSSDNNTVSTDGAVITAVKPGEATIVAVTANGLTDSIKVVVKDIAYNAEAMKKALIDHSDVYINYRISSELRDLDFDGVPELIQHTGSYGSIYSHCIYIYRFDGAGWKSFFKIAGSGSFFPMIDNRTGQKRYFFEGYLHNNDNISGTEGSAGDYIIKLHEKINDGNIGEAVLSCESDSLYAEKYIGDVYFKYNDAYTGQKYLTDSLPQYAEFCNEFYRRHVPITAYCQDSDVVEFNSGNDTKAFELYENELILILDNYNKGVKSGTAAEERTVKLKQHFIIAKPGEKISAEIVYSPAGMENDTWYYGNDNILTLNKDGCIDIDNSNFKIGKSNYIYAVSGGAKSYYCTVYINATETAEPSYPENEDGFIDNGIWAFKYGSLLAYLGDKRHVVIPEKIYGYSVTSIISSVDFFESDFISLTLPKYFEDEALGYFSPRYTPTKAFPQTLRDFYVDPENLHFISVDGVLFSNDKKELVYYPPGRTDDTYYVPEGTEIIGHGAFFNNPHIKQIVFPASVREIGPCIVELCYNLETLCFSSTDIKIHELAYFMEDVQIFFATGGYIWDRKINENIKTVKVLKDSAECISGNEDIAKWVDENIGLNNVSVIFKDISYIYEDGFYAKYSSDGKALKLLTEQEKIRQTLDDIYDRVHTLFGHPETYIYKAIFRFIDLNFDGFPEMLVYPLVTYSQSMTGEIRQQELGNRNFMSIFDISKSVPELLGNMFTAPSSVFGHFIDTETGEKKLMFSDTFEYEYKSMPEPSFNFYNLVMDVDLSSGHLQLSTYYDDCIDLSIIRSKNDYRPAGKILFAYISDSRKNIVQYVGYDSKEEYYTDYNAYFSRVKPSGTLRKEVALNLVEQKDEIDDILCDLVLEFLDESK